MHLNMFYCKFCC